MRGPREAGRFEGGIEGPPRGGPGAIGPATRAGSERGKDLNLHEPLKQNKLTSTVRIFRSILKHAGDNKLVERA